jgi:hypothetical protein
MQNNYLQPEKVLETFTGQGCEVHNDRIRVSAILADLRKLPQNKCYL